jgi:hypothetical protein
MNPLNGTKSPFQSRGVWGGIVAIIAMVASMVGYTLTDADQAALTLLLPGIVSGVGGVLAIIGRIGATKKIG